MTMSPQPAPSNASPNSPLSSVRPAVVYARVSSREQEQEGFSIPAQRKLLHTYAHQHQFQIMQEFIDIETAKHTGRTNFQAMMNYLTAHPTVKSLLVEKTDRLSGFR
jgi:DNA invertase Pin-like site-specific DNA recombinase